MKKKILKNLFLSVLFAGGFNALAQAQQPPATLTDDVNVRFLNVGHMNVHTGGFMYVQGGIGMLDVTGVNNNNPTEVQVVHNGVTHLEGNFWQDTRGNVFEIEPWSDWTPILGRPRGMTTSTGTIHFVGNNNPGGTTSSVRQITTSDWDAFDRRDRYIAFPHIMINTRDTIMVPPQMGIDARTIGRNSSTQGVIFLQSDVLGSGTNKTQWNASLRVTSIATNDADIAINAISGVNPVPAERRFVAPDAVVVAKFVRYFREMDPFTETPQSTALMPFSPPYWDMRAAYFAGNWVRRPIFEEDRNSVSSPLGNRLGLGGFTNADQFVTDPFAPMGFQARERSIMSGVGLRLHGTRQAYLIRLQSSDLDMNDLPLNITHGQDGHLDSVFIFDGNPFPEVLGLRSDRHLFAGHPVLVESTMLPSSAFPSIDGVGTVALRTGAAQRNPQSWLAGNSYTSGLNAQAIFDYIRNINDVRGLNAAIFEPEIRIFPHGGVSYIVYDAANISDADIQAMGIFMIRAAAADTPNQIEETIVIGSEFQIHTGGITQFAEADNSNGRGLRRTQEQSSRLNFILTPEHNPLIFSRSDVLFDTDASLNADNLDIAMVANSAAAFQLFGTNSTGARLQRNALPYTAEMALLGVVPAANPMWVTLTALDADNFAAQMVELYDRQTGRFIQDLRANRSYTFLLSPGDDLNRFEVRFTPRSGTTDIEDNHITNWSIHNNRSQLTVTGLSHSLIGETMRIFNAAGVLHIQQPINGTVEYINIQDLPSGVYLITIQGRTERFVK